MPTYIIVGFDRTDGSGGVSHNKIGVPKL